MVTILPLGVLLIKGEGWEDSTAHLVPQKETKGINKKKKRKNMQLVLNF